MKQIRFTLLSLIVTAFSSVAQEGGNSLHFDGVDDYVDCQLPNVFTDIGSNEFTVELWLNQETSQFCRLFFAQDDANNFMSISLTNTNEIVLYLTANTVNHSIQSTDLIVNNEWTHIAVTWNPTSSEAKIYKDGSEVAYATGVYVSSTGNDNVLSLGSRTDGNQVFAGEMDEVSVWEVAKDECEIAFNRFFKRSGTETSLETYYNFNHGVAAGNNASFDLLEDVTVNGTDGTLTNFGLSGTSSNWLNSGLNILGDYGAQSNVLFSGTSYGIYSQISGADVYQWYNCDTDSIIVGATNYTFDPGTEDPDFLDFTNYGVIVTVGACKDTSNCELYGFFSLDENDPKEILSVYPNPSNGIFSIDLPDDAKEVQIVSLSGLLVDQFLPNGESKMKIDLSGLDGFYMVHVYTKSTVLQSKICVQKGE